MTRILIAALSLWVLFSRVQASEFISFDVEDFSERLAAAYSTSAGLEPIEAGKADELRVWTEDPMSGDVHGFIIVRAGIRQCQIHGDNDGNGIKVHRARCGQMRPKKLKAARLLALLDDLASLDGQSVGCDDVMDGWEMLVEGRRNGRAFRYFAGNPDQCDDPGAIRGRRPTDILWE